MAGYSLELETIKRLGKLLKAYESGGFTPTIRQYITEDYGQPIEPGLQIVEVTGPIEPGAYYPANLIEYNGVTWSTIYSIKVFELNGKLLTTRRYFAKIVSTVTINNVEFEVYAVYSPGQVVTDVTCSPTGAINAVREKL